MKRFLGPPGNPWDPFEVFLYICSGYNFGFIFWVFYPPILRIIEGGDEIHPPPLRYRKKRGPERVKNTLTFIIFITRVFFWFGLSPYVLYISRYRTPYDIWYMIFLTDTALNKDEVNTGLSIILCLFFTLKIESLKCVKN